MMKDYMQEQNTTTLSIFALYRNNDTTILGICYLVVSTLVMAANGVVVFVIVKTRELHLPTLWVIAHMAVWDFMYGFYHLAVAVPSAFLNRFAFTEGLIPWLASLLTLIVSQNLFSTTMTVLDRYIAIKWPLQYPNIATKKKYSAAVLLSCLLSICRLLCVFLPDLDFYYNDDIAVCVSDFNTVGGTFASLFLFAVTFLVIIICCIQILFEMTRGKRHIFYHRKKVIRQVNVTKFTVMVTFCARIYCTTSLPVCISIILNFVYGKENLPSWFVKLSMVSLLSNSLWNVFIYTASYKPFTDALLSIFCKSYFRRRQQAVYQATFRKRSGTGEITLHF